MRKFAPLILLTLLISLPGRAQDLQVFGSIKVNAKSVKIGPKPEQLYRKRFYLLRGGFEANKALLEKLRALEPVSRDCFYCRSGASQGFVDWLRAENCESPYCREITAEDLKKVPEFQAAYKKGLTQFPRRPEIAQKWVTTNLPAGLRDGFYRQKKTMLASLLGGAAPMQSVMTDKVNASGLFIDIPLDPGAKNGEMFFVSNLLPIEMDGKGYIWACQVEVKAGTPGTIVLQTQSIPKKCELIVKPLPVCTAGSCDIK